MPTSPRRRLHNLPHQLSSFIGREREIAEIKRLLGTTRLLTLTGSGGCGKTRLALQVAADLGEHYPDGVWLVQLAPLSDPALVPKAVADALSIPEQPRRSLTETLADHLPAKTLLLVLDNCEHLLPACAHLVDALLRTSSNLQVLATSREGLGTEGEMIYRVPSLSVPDPKRLPSPDGLAQYEAVRLFVERAAFSKPGFELTAGNATAVAHVVSRLDGIPLAIELAAGRVKALSVDTIATRLDDQFRLLTGGSRTAVPRHQTLRAALDWSVALLSEPERILLRQLSVFAGGFTLDAAEHVCSGEGVGATDVLDLVTRLVDKSLVVFEERDGKARYRLLGTVRQYGAEHLEDANETQAVRQKHRDWCLELAEEAELKLHGPEQRAWFDRLETEHDNLRAALDWSEGEQGGAERELRLAGALRDFWYIRGYWHEGRGRLERALTRSADAPRAVLCKALSGAASFAWGHADDERSAQLSEQGLRLCRAAGDEEGIARFLRRLGMVAFNRGDHARAIAFHGEALGLYRKRGDAWSISGALHGQAASTMFQGDYERAVALEEESLAFAREAGDASQIAVCLRTLAWVDSLQGNYRQARAHFKESLMQSREVGSRQVSSECLAGLAWAAAALGNYDHAARLFGAAGALFNATGYRPSPAVRAEFEQHMCSTREHLGDSTFETARAAGEAMTLEQAIEYAIATTDSPVATPTPKPRASAVYDAGRLTRREREVATLIAQGSSNRDIAARLVLSERTVETHVQNILNKLGADSRTYIATWALRHGLVTTSPE